MTKETMNVHQALAELLNVEGSKRKSQNSNFIFV